MILIDDRPTRARRGMDWYHMATDNLAEDGLEELHAMARRLGLRTRWLHHHAGLPHYDVPAEVKREAIMFGAAEVTTRELIRRCKRTNNRFRDGDGHTEESLGHQVVEFPPPGLTSDHLGILDIPWSGRGRMDRNNGFSTESIETEGYSPDTIDQWLRAWTLLTGGTSERLARVRSDIESAAASLDMNSPGHLAVEMRMKGNDKLQIARALGVSNSRGATILREAEEHMARHLGWGRVMSDE